jgi:hypothetical protein
MNHLLLFLLGALLGGIAADIFWARRFAREKTRHAVEKSDAYGRGWTTGLEAGATAGRRLDEGYLEYLRVGQEGANHRMGKPLP